MSETARAPAEGSGGTAVVVVGGPPPDPVDLADLPPDATVIAANGGLDHARALGLRVDRVVGDLDSASPQALAAAEAGGATVERHPEAKDATDLELALDAALAAGCDRIVVLGADGGRLDHLLAVVSQLGSDRYAGAAVEARLGLARLFVVRTAVTLHGRPGDIVTLLPLHGPAEGVTTDGLLYPLHGEDLAAGSGRGVSNEMVGERAGVALRAGVLVAILPGVAGSHWRRVGARPGARAWPGAATPPADNAAPRQ